jgi:hypothetical protein
MINLLLHIVLYVTHTGFLLYVETNKLYILKLHDGQIWHEEVYKNYIRCCALGLKWRALLQIVILI